MLSPICYINWQKNNIDKRMTDYEKIDNWIDAHFDEQVAFLQALIRVPTDTPPGNNAPHAERTSELLQAMGLDTEKHAVPQAEVDAAGLESITNLIVRRKYGPGKTVLLNAHGDVVPPGEGWTKDPYGGEIDSVELLFTYDEEFGGEVGPAWLLKHQIIKPDLMIAAGFSYQVITAHNGCLQMEVTVHGKMAHAAIPESGVDALQAASKILTALYAQNTLYKLITSNVEGITHPYLNIGTIEGGTNTNVVPGRVTFKLDRRMIPEENPEKVEATLRQLIFETAAQTPGVTVDIKRILLARAMQPLAGNKPLVDSLQRHGRAVFGELIPALGTPLYTDVRLFCEAGIPGVIYGAGPRTVLESHAKRADERLALEDLRRATKVIARALSDLLA